VRIGIGVSEDLTIHRQQEVARSVEQAGASSLWTNEARGRDAFLVCQAWAAATSELEVGIGVVPIWSRSAAQIAMATATLQEASGGRFLLGLGVSHPATMDNWHGAEHRRPLTAAEETLRIVGKILRGERTDVEGEVMSSTHFHLQMTPPPPEGRILLAAMGPKMLELAGARSGGTLLNWSSPTEVARAAARVRAGAAGSPEGRDPAKTYVGAYVRVAVDEDRDRARRALAREISSYLALDAYAEHFRRQGFGDEVATVKSAYREGGADAATDAVPEVMLSDLGWYGTPDDDPTGTIERYASSGLDELVARVVVTGDEPVGSVRAVLDAIFAG
jgi:probable F420-dependent oxidoreductase